MEKVREGLTLKYLIAVAIAALALVVAFPAGALAAEEGGGFWDDPIGSVSSYFSGAKDASADVLDAGSVADPSTSGQWEEYMYSSTENTGRIWTDKSVTTEDSATLDGQVVTKTADSDFMVSLSALSSVLDSTSSVLVPTDPMDIVLVLDTSGSMDYTMDGKESQETTTYEPIYNLDKKKTYYIEGFLGYQQVTYKGGAWKTSGIFGSTYVPKKSAEDSSSGHVQFYDRVTKKSDTRMDALRASVSNFVGQVEEQNKKLDPDRQHRVSLVKFASSENNKVGNGTDRQGYNYSQVVSDFTTSTDTIVKMVNAINPSGATQADYGFNQAKRVIEGDNSASSSGDKLGGARADAQKIVIFFTDGTPTSKTEFNSKVANSAVKTANELKSNDVSVYSVGIFEGATPELPSRGTSNENRFMHAVSSNYPEAKAYDNLGAPVDNPHYYKTAATSEELNKIFDEIFKDINSNSGLPTEVEQGHTAANSGYITFTDKLGDYMTVTGVNGLIYEGVLYDQVEKIAPKAGSNVTTYVFKGKVDGTDCHPLMKLENIVMTVEAPAKGASTGDIVTVKIPAANIPMRHFDVVNNGDGSSTMSACDMTPIRIAYSVALREGVNEKLITPDEAMTQYMSANSQAGRINFYSNDFDRDTRVARTTAEYVPAKTNPYYYFIQDVQLYTKSGNEYIPARSELDLNGNYYYKNYYYALTDDAQVGGELSGPVTAEYKWIEISGDALKADSPFITQDNEGNLVVKAGCPKNARVGNTTVNKVDNITSTAPLAIKYQWAGEGKVSVGLGNNGLMQKVPLGNLKLTKTVTADDGLKAPDTAFAFKISIADKTGDPLKGEFRADCTNSDITSIRFNQDGIGKVFLKAGESITIKGLPTGINFEIVESPEDGFTTSIVDDSGEDTTDGKGMIAPGLTTVAFTNAFSPLVINGATELNGAKILNGRDWSAEESFAFTMTPDAATKAAMADGVLNVEGADADTQVQTVNVTSPSDSVYKNGQEYGFHFGDMTITKPGTYAFTIAETAGDTQGLTYDGQVYTLTINVANENGEWVVDKAITTAEGEPADVKFVNTYSAKGSLAIALHKELTGRDWKDGEEFTFVIEPAVEGNDIPLPEPNTVTVTKPADGNIADIVFPEVEYTNKGAGVGLNKVYTYKVTEVVPQSVQPAVTYDATPITVTVTANDDGLGTITPVQEVTPDDTFTNAYEASVSYSQVGGLNVEKVLKGHDVAPGQFSFEIQAADDKSAEKMKTIDPEWTDASYVKTISTTNPAEAGKSSVIPVFGDLIFTTAESGTSYTYTIKEKLPEGYQTGDVVDGITYDDRTFTFSITPEDDGNGVISVTTRVEGSDGFNATFTTHDEDDYRSPAVITFNNSYEAKGSFTVDATKTLNGRNMEAGEFSFQLAYPATATTEAQVIGEATNAPAEAGVAADVAFDAVSLTKAQIEKMVAHGQAVQSDDGTYTIPLTVTETGTLPQGVTATDGAFALNVVVTDQDNGKLQCDVVYPEGAAAVPFVNTYKASKVAVELKGQKTLNFDPVYAGLSLTLNDIADAYTFELDPHDNAPLPVNENGEEVTSVTNNADGVINFGSLVFTAEDMDGADSKTFVYTVTENGTFPGVTNDATNAKEVSITVTDDGTGKLVASTDGSFLFGFTNTYSVESKFSTVRFSKTLTGRDLRDGEFMFGLYLSDADEKGGPASRAITNSAGQGVFGYTFKEPGTYTFLAKELKGDQPIGGIQYDDEVYTVTAVVTDAKNGTMDVEWSFTNSAGEAVDTMAFENAYVAEGAIPALGGVKIVDGRDWKNGESFSFNLTTADNATKKAVSDGVLKLPKNTTVTLTATSKSPKLNGEAYPFSFDEMKVTKTGTYKFYITENQPGSGKTDLSYDTDKYLVTVVVTDNDKNGVLTSTISYDRKVAGNTKSATERSKGITPVFVNDFIEQPVTLKIPFTKTLDGRDWKQGEAFVFNLTAETPDAPLAANNTVQVTKPSKGNTAKFDFNIEYTVDDLKGADEKTFKYKVTEVNAGAGGMTYDTSRLVTVTVKHNTSTGLLEANYTVKGGSAFVNTYAPEKATSSVTDALAVTKVLENRALHAGDFKFGMYDKNNKLVASGANDAEGTVQLSSITFKKPGTYQYTIKEIQPTKVETGMTYDDKVYTVKAVVTDTHDGKLAVKWSCSNLCGTKMIFKNSYTPASVVASPSADFTKHVLGRAWQDNESFTFKVKANSSTPKAPLPEVTEITVNKGEGNTGSFFVGPFEYSLSDLGKKITKSTTKTFKYDIVEVAGTDANMAYDTTARTLQVDLAYDYDKGTLTAKTKVVGSATNPTVTSFVNKYKAPVAKVAGSDLTFTKEITGRQWANDEKFAFTITGEKGAPMPKNTEVEVGKPASGNSNTFNFGDIKFSMDDLGGNITADKTKTFTYTVHEKIPSDAQGGELNGLEYDTRDRKVTIEVSYDYSAGALSAQVKSIEGVEEGDSTVFVNTYTSEATYSGLRLTKTLMGHDMASDQFSFDVTATNDAAKAVFGEEPITVNSPAAHDGAGSSIVLFTDVAFTQDNAGDVLTLAVKENVPEGYENGQAVNGYTYDTTVHKLKITVSDDGLGHLTTASSIDGTEVVDAMPTIAFTNKYAASTTDATAFVLKAHKALDGRSLKANEFNFVLSDALGNEIETVSNAADGSIAFSPINYSSKNFAADVEAGKAVYSNGAYEYTYNVAEKTELPGGVSQSYGSEQVVVKVTDNNDGTLKTEATYADNGKAGQVDFVNVYDTEDISLSFTGKKNLELANPELALTLEDIAGKFTFTLTGEEGAPMPENTTAVNDAAGNFGFGPLTYTLKDLGGSTEKTFTYKVTESVTPGMKDQVKGLSLDTKAHEITVTVKDNGDGTLSSQVSQAYENGPQVAITNTYSVEDKPSSPSGQGNLDVSKTLINRQLAEGEFNFVLKNAAGEEIETVANAADGSISFSEIVFDTPGIYTYTVSEVVPEDKDADPSINYDPSETTIQADVVDTKQGTLKVTWTVPDAESNVVNFENYYDPSDVVLGGEADDSLTFTKTVTGRDWQKDEAFTFNLYEVTDPNSPEEQPRSVEDPELNLVKQVEVTNPDADESQEFSVGPLAFNFYDLLGENDFATTDLEKEFTYVLCEEAGNADGMTYDVAKRQITVLASYDYAEGTMNAEVTSVINLDNPEATDAEAREFVNSYKAAEVTSSPTGEGNLTITKKLTGRDLASGEFEFVMKNKSGDEVLTAANNAAGKVNFGELTFTEAGTYTYTISEVVNKDAEGVTFDKTKHKVQALVTDNMDGTLSVEWKTTDGGKDITFVNDFMAPLDPDVPESDRMPQTNDSPLPGILLGIVGGLAGVSALAYFRLRKQQ